MQQQIWHQSYPSDFPKEIDTAGISTLVATLERSFRLYPDRIAAFCLGEALSYGRLEVLSTNLASHLRQLELEKGDRVALMMPNCLAYLVAMAGVLQAGLTIVNVNPLYTPRELEHQLRDSGTRCLIIAEGLTQAFEQIADHTAVEHVLTAPLAALMERIRAHESGQAAVQPDSSTGSTRPLASVIARGGNAHPGDLRVTLDDIAFLQYTGGTTGVSKGAMLTHKSVGVSLELILLWLAPPAHDAPISIVLPLPLYHVYPLAVALLSIATGSSLRLIPNPRDPVSVLDELRREPFDMFMGVNTLFNSLVDSPDLQRVDFSRTSYVIGAGASVQQAVVKRWIAAGGMPITEAYGLTETSPCAMFNPPGRNGSIGVPMPSTDVRVVDDDGVPVPLNAPGELLIKGPQLFAGYWNNPEETSKAFTPDGWFKTGDIVTMGDDGFMQIVDRKKDMILVSGFNVYPNEIEAVAAAHPEVVECACIGVPDARSGEVPHLFVVPRSPDVTPEQIRQHCREQLTAYKIPRHITFTSALPKSPVGKILRKDLRR
ncbi:long-chain fatty acid--CoA ligase [Pseudomonas sp. BN417]|uniref:AMP-binding protein n=1 Tax=Pseudomonas sp. BN417 TaxID=2567890 RepID=UPI0024554D23|nr:AMP-binding protein [Pseudomonas sp. BN417]MDH4559061.1 long-chain fatty acid--CoA ligase [Pseudomonas sp. BN417]